MTIPELIEDMVSYYKTHPRGMNANGSECVYIDNESGNMCAVGRCLDWGKLNSQDYLPSFVFVNDQPPVSRSTVEQEFEDVLLPEYRGHQGWVWLFLQDLHDTAGFWEPNDAGGNDLSVSGLAKVQDILRVCELGHT